MSEILGQRMLTILDQKENELRQMNDQLVAMGATAPPDANDPWREEKAFQNTMSTPTGREDAQTALANAGEWIRALCDGGKVSTDQWREGQRIAKQLTAMAGRD